MGLGKYGGVVIEQGPAEVAAAQAKSDDNMPWFSNGAVVLAINPAAWTLRDILSSDRKDIST